MDLVHLAGDVRCGSVLIRCTCRDVRATSEGQTTDLSHIATYPNDMIIAVVYPNGMVIGETPDSLSKEGRVGGLPGIKELCDVRTCMYVHVHVCMY